MSYRNPRTDYYDALTTSDEPWKLAGGILVAVSFIAAPLVAILVPGAALIALIAGAVGVIGGLTMCAVGHYKHNKEVRKYLWEEREIRLQNSQTYAKGYEKGMEKHGIAYPMHPNVGCSPEKRDINYDVKYSTKSCEKQLER